jgi:Sporulation and spore germination
MKPRLALFGALSAIALMGIWVLLVVVPRWYVPKQDPESAPATTSSAGPTRKIKARLFYVAEDGLRLVASEQEVIFGEGTLEQGRRLIEAQLGTAPPPLVSAIPAGTKLRDLFITETGDSSVAFVDLSSEVTSGHPGGALSELLTVYTIVDLLTENLPAITSVQILVDGKEADTLAGHVDLRRPLVKDPRWTEESQQTNPVQ